MFFKMVLYFIGSYLLLETQYGACRKVSIVLGFPVDNWCHRILNSTEQQLIINTRVWSLMQYNMHNVVCFESFNCSKIYGMRVIIIIWVLTTQYVVIPPNGNFCMPLYT